MKIKAGCSLTIIAARMVCASHGEEVAMTAEKAMVITFPSQTQRTYKLLSAPNASGDWTTLQDGIVGTGGEVTIFYKSESDQKLFFKVETSEGPVGQRSLLSLANLDISNKDLSGYDLEGADIRGYTFTASKFDGADLTAANLSEANFYHASFIGADLGHAVAVRVNMNGAKLNGANLEGVRFVGGTLAFADLQNANLRGVVFDGVQLMGANLAGQMLTNVSLRSVPWPGLDHVDFSGANLSGADLSWNSAHGLNLAGANITGVNFEGSGLWGVSLEGRDLRSVGLRGIAFDGNWELVNASGVDMSLAWVGTAWNPAGATLVGTNLEGFIAGSPDYSWGITNVNFRDANLQGAYLVGMTFRNCDFTGANLSFADVSAADFTGCVGLNTEQPGLQFGGLPQNPPPAPPRPTATILPDGTPRVGTNPGSGLAPATVPAKLQLVTNDGGSNTIENIQLNGSTFWESGVEAGTFTYEARGRVAVLKLTRTATARTSVRKLLFTSATGGDLYNSDSGGSFKIGIFTVPE